MGMGDSNPTEATALLQSETQGIIEEQPTVGESLRRHSSACYPPYHEEYTPANEPASALTIWTTVPVSLLGTFSTDR